MNKMHMKKTGSYLKVCKFTEIIRHFQCYRGLVFIHTFISAI